MPIFGIKFGWQIAHSLVLTRETWCQSKRTFSFGNSSKVLSKTSLPVRIYTPKQLSFVSVEESPNSPRKSSSEDHEDDPPPPPSTTGQNTSGTAATAVYSYVPSNFPIPAPMVCKGNLVANWEFFRQQWEDYEVATGLDK